MSATNMFGRQNCQNYSHGTQGFGRDGMPLHYFSTERLEQLRYLSLSFKKRKKKKTDCKPLCQFDNFNCVVINYSCLFALLI